MIVILTFLLSLAPCWLAPQGGKRKLPEPLAGKMDLHCELRVSLAFFLTKEIFLSAIYDKSLITKLVLLRWLYTTQSPFFVCFYRFGWKRKKKRRNVANSQWLRKLVQYSIFYCFVPSWVHFQKELKSVQNGRGCTRARGLVFKVWFRSGFDGMGHRLW